MQTTPGCNCSQKLDVAPAEFLTGQEPKPYPPHRITNKQDNRHVDASLEHQIDACCSTRSKAGNGKERQA